MKCSERLAETFISVVWLFNPDLGWALYDTYLLWKGKP